MRTRLLSVTLVVGAVAIACSSSPDPQAEPTQTIAPAGTPVGQQVRNKDAAPAFTVETFNHGTYSLEQSVGHPVLINFWFPSCPPCAAELPDLQAAFEQYGDQVDFIGVQQTSVDTASAGVKFLDDIGITYPNFADETGSTFARVQLDYQVLVHPTTVFLNRDHTINRTWTGLISEQALDEQIRNVIGS